MEFVHGVNMVPRYDEMSPLDKAIDRYNKQAKKHFAELNASENAS